MSIENTSMVHIGMSILNLRPQTLDNLKKLYEWAASCDYLTVTIFNKTESEFISFDASSNFRIIEMGYEDLFTTMTRLEISQCTHVWWVNDDDYFDATNFDAFKNLNSDTLYLPSMEVVSDFGTGLIDWTDLISQYQPADQYLSYWKIGAPLIFSILPVSTFRSWVNFVSRDPFHLPHLDTQLNLLASLVERKIHLADFTYHYGTQNWQDVKSVIASANRYAVEQSMDSNYIFTMNLVRNIENVCIIVSYFKENKRKIPNSLLAAVLDQFGPFQNGRKAFIYKTFLPAWVRSKIIMHNLDFEAKKYFGGTTHRIRALLIGAVNFRRPEELQVYFEDSEVFNALLVPQMKQNFWRSEITN